MRKIALSKLADGAADVFLETERKDFRMFSLEERERAVELYFTTPMTTAQVVEHLGYPTRQCLERWLAMDSRYAGHMAKRGADAFLEVASQPFAGGTISRCWHILFTR